MRKRLYLSLAVVLGLAVTAAAQQFQPVSLISDLHVKPGKDQEFMELVKKYREPVFTKLMAEGAVLAWGVDVPVIHEPGMPTHSIWFACADTSGLDKVFAAYEQLDKTTAEEDAKAASEASKKRQPAPKTIVERIHEVIDLSKYKDWFFRDLVAGFANTMPPADAKPYGWIGTTRVLPGKGAEYRALWEKYNKPVYEKLLKAGDIGGYSLGVEEVRTTDAFSHYTWAGLPNLAAREKVRAAFNADRQARSAEERAQITQSFLSVTDPSASRTVLLRTILLRVAPPPK